MTTPTSKSWEAKEKFLDSPVNSIGLKLGEMILHNGEIIRDIPEVIDALNSVLEQERKDERQRAIQEIIWLVNEENKLWEYSKKQAQEEFKYGDALHPHELWKSKCDGGDSATSRIITKLNQLKEE